jgi:uncharacterized membrane protein
MLVYWNTALAGPYLRTTDSPPAFSPKERAAMRKVTRRQVWPIALLVLLALLAYLAVHRKGETAEEAEDEAVEAVVKVEEKVGRDDYVVAAFLGVTALFAFVMWTALRAKEGEDKAMPPARESSANDKTAVR